jgi:hypothetical protein
LIPVCFIKIPFLHGFWFEIAAFLFWVCRGFAGYGFLVIGLEAS